MPKGNDLNEMVIPGIKIETQQIFCQIGEKGLRDIFNFSLLMLSV